jgi:hypothetical protein
MPFSFKPPQAAAAQNAFSAAAIGTKLKENKGQVFTFLCFLSVGVMAFATVVLYTYQASLKKTVDEKKAELATKDSSVGNLPIEKMKKLSRKLRSAGNLVNQRTSASTAFKILEETIEDKSLYLSVELHASPVGQYEMIFSGEAPSYKSVVQQTEAFKLKMYGKYIVKSELVSAAPTQEGSISFNYKAVFAMKGVFPEDVMMIDSSASSSAKTNVTSQ